MAFKPYTLCIPILLLAVYHTVEGKVIWNAGLEKRGVLEDEPNELKDVVMVGCYVDNSKDKVFTTMYESFRGKRNLDLWQMWPNFTEIAVLCADAAKRRGFQYFGIEYYAECWSGLIGGEWKASDHQESQNCIGRVGKGNTVMVYKFDGCHSDGKFYPNGSEMPKDDPCMTCKCSEGQEICYTRQCLISAYCAEENIVMGKDNCCHICACRHNGVAKDDGETWKDKIFPNDTCTQCTCTDGKANCVLLLSGCTEPTPRPTVPPETERPTFTFPDFF